MTDHPTLLLQVIEKAERIIVRPTGGFDPVERQAELEALKEALKAKQMPIDGVTLIDHWDVLAVDVMILAERMRALGEYGKAAEWSMVLGVMLPKVREHFSAASDWRRNTRPTP